MSKLRYNIGQTVLAIFYVMNGRVNWVNPVYQPWLDKLDKILTTKLVVTERHKVAWDQDPKAEAQYDGFKLKSEDGIEFGNQYPKASYGQLSTEADHYFSRLWPEGTKFDDKSDEALADYEDIATVIDRVNRGITHFGKEVESNNKPENVRLYTTYKEQLEVHRKDLVALVEAAGGKVTTEVIWPDVPEITRTVVTF